MMSNIIHSPYSGLLHDQTTTKPREPMTNKSDITRREFARQSTYYSWVLEESQLDLRPSKFEFGPLPVAPMAIPGRTDPV